MGKDKRISLFITRVVSAAVLSPDPCVMNDSRASVNVSESELVVPLDAILNIV